MRLKQYLIHTTHKLITLVSPVIQIIWRRYVRKKQTLYGILFLLAYISVASNPDPAGYLSTATKRVASLGNCEIHIMEGGDSRLRIHENNKTLLKVNLGYFLPSSAPEIFTFYGKSLSFVWKQGLQLDLTHEVLKGGRRYNVTWKVTNQRHPILKDVISMETFNWFGGTTINKLDWPIEKWNTKLMPFITGDQCQGDYGNIQERYWLSSAGIAVAVDYYDPLFVQFNGRDKMMTLVSQWKYPYQKEKSANLHLSYSIYQAADIVAVHKLARSYVFAKPKGVPDSLVFRYPIWTTWIVYKWFINQDKVIKYAKDIRRYGFNASQIEIDDDWTPHYGDLIFDSLKFPDPAAMVRTIQQLDFRVTLWIPPFCTLRSDAYSVPNIWVKGSWTGIVSWWNGYGRLLDVTNPLAERWLKTYLYRLRLRYNITAYKFDAGEATYLPRGYKTYRKLKSPSDYTKHYVQMAARIDGNVKALEIRSATAVQHLPVFTRLMDKASSWGYDNGLKTLIPHAIQVGLLGYPFIIPDIIGGNQYHLHQCDKELYIRWLQASVFMPVLQFSKPPWHFDNESVAITQEMTKLHLHYSEYIIDLATDAVRTGDPIVRPIWWMAPDDKIALEIDSEFLLGNYILVAPVLTPNVRLRDIYLPKGRWERNGKTYTGPGWLRDYPAPLKDIVYFQLKDSTGYFRKVTGAVTNTNHRRL